MKSHCDDRKKPQLPSNILTSIEMPNLEKEEIKVSWFTSSCWQLHEWRRSAQWVRAGWSLIKAAWVPTGVSFSKSHWGATWLSSLRSHWLSELIDLYSSDSRKRYRQEEKKSKRHVFWWMNWGVILRNSKCLFSCWRGSRWAAGSQDKTPSAQLLKPQGIIYILLRFFIIKQISVCICCFDLLDFP